MQYKHNPKTYTVDEVTRLLLYQSSFRQVVFINTCT